MSETATAATMATTKGLKAFNAMIQSPKTQNYLQDVLGERKPEFVNNVVALVANSEQLQQCENQSILYAAIKATALNLPLDPNLGLAYVLPYWDNKNRVQKAQFQIGYQGWKQLAIRSGQVVRLHTTDIREGELISEDILTGEIQIRRAPDRDNKKIIGYAAYMKLKNGYEVTNYMTREQVEAHALEYTKQKTKDGKQLAGAWASHFDAMAKKTVLIPVLKDAPLSIEMKMALEADATDPNLMQADYQSANIQDAEIISMDPQPETREPETRQAPATNVTMNF